VHLVRFEINSSWGNIQRPRAPNSGTITGVCLVQTLDGNVSSNFIAREERGRRRCIATATAARSWPCRREMGPADATGVRRRTERRRGNIALGGAVVMTGKPEAYERRIPQLVRDVAITGRSGGRGAGPASHGRSSRMNFYSAGRCAALPRPIWASTEAARLA
jgi:hypothetical protein